MKYKLTDEKTLNFMGQTLYRIEAVENFGSIKKGDKGGFIEFESNLSQSGEAWVSGKAQVFGEAQVSGEAQVYGEAWVFGEAQVYGEAWVFGEARVSGEAWVFGEARVYGEAQVSGEAQVYGEAWVYGKAWVYSKARVYGKAQVSGEAQVAFDVTQVKYICIGQFGEYYRYVTATQSKIYCGCFEGSLLEFEKEVSGKYGTDFGSYADCIKILRLFMAENQ